MTRWRKVLRAVVRVLAIGYPVALLSVVLLFSRVGESWWLTTVCLYLPRVVLAGPLPILAGLLWFTGSRGLLWTQALSALVILFPLMGLAVNLPHSSAPDASRLRVMSYNINSGGTGVDDILAEIDRYAPDVLVMEEVGWLDDLKRKLGDRYPTVDSAGQFMTASRYPMTYRFAPDNVAYGGRLRSARYIVETFQTPSGPVTFYGVHPLSPREDRGALGGPHGFRRLLFSGQLVASGGPHRVEENAGLREAQLRTAADLARQDPGPVVIAGDTNLPGLSRVLRQSFGSFTDGFATVGAGFGYTYPTKLPFTRLDRIFTNDKLRFTHFEVGTSRASDHLCVVADLTRPSHVETQ
jgi:vancomycin resistance protein VanJ